MRCFELVCELMGGRGGWVLSLMVTASPSLPFSIKSLVLMGKKYIALDSACCDGSYFLSFKLGR